MLKVKTKRPPLYMPSSGSIVKVKFRMSSGFSKWVFMVLPRESSERSMATSWSAGCKPVALRRAEGNIATGFPYLSALEAEQQSPSSSSTPRWQPPPAAASVSTPKSVQNHEIESKRQAKAAKLTIDHIFNMVAVGCGNQTTAQGFPGVELAAGQVILGGEQGR